MVDNQKSLLRAAERIFSHLQRLRAAPVLVELPETHWTECQSLIHKIHHSRIHSWNHAAALLEDRLERALSRCLERLQETSRHVSSSGRQSPPQTAREIFRDLVALSDEFESVTIDVPNQTLSVMTEPIVLEEIGLGRFEIGLHWDRIGECRPYEVVALEPNRAIPSIRTSGANRSAKATDSCRSSGLSRQDACWTSSRSSTGSSAPTTPAAPMSRCQAGTAAPAPIAETCSVRTTNMSAIAAATCSAENA
jgi:hypothetical protein